MYIIYMLEDSVLYNVHKCHIYTYIQFIRVKPADIIVYTQILHT